MPSAVHTAYNIVYTDSIEHCELCIISYLCLIMIEKEPTPYPERTEDGIVLVYEPAAEYGKPIVYQGTTITNTLKDYYSFTTNHEKVDVLKWIVAQPAFTELKRLSLAENKIYTLYTNQYDEMLQTGEKEFARFRDVKTKRQINAFLYVQAHPTA